MMIIIIIIIIINNNNNSFINDNAKNNKINKRNLLTTLAGQKRKEFKETGCADIQQNISN